MYFEVNFLENFPLFLKNNDIFGWDILQFSKLRLNFILMQDFDGDKFGWSLVIHAFSV